MHAEKPNTDSRAALLKERLMGMIAPSLDHGDRQGLVDCMTGRVELDPKTLDTHARDIAPPPRDWHARWAEAFVRHTLEHAEPERLAAMLADGDLACTRIYIAWQAYCADNREAMDADLERLRGSDPSQ